MLRDLIDNDWEIIHQLGLDEKVTRFMADYIKVKNEEEAKVWVSERIGYNSQNPRESYNLAITRKDDNKVIGWIGVGKPDDPAVTAKEISEVGDLDFGYAIKPEYWGSGYASEALIALIRFCFSLPRIK